jgi:hypothetical protein
MTKPEIEELEKLLREKVSPDDLLKSVRQPPIVNTFGQQSIIDLETINLIPAPGKDRYFRNFENGDKVIYWRSSDNDIGVEIVGVVWDKNQNPKVISGVILPP